ncbi:RNA polymerase sigma-70 factor (sigma-E family) [Stackebrandtia albiflava]|uniref:RNA polymerase sigma-70 factor (Sigma-E family) n=1 Tax=Stackebrandtia albiflava TaxID=406432 RepID=A0A562UPM2_9ACTN|nr:SigE family RNA polymerase sigma factor [Stackebrandtia albiflava]TWJ07573.1 RNA polymerase sigma-70 factor (sigma-E family) [Stackebrandtia albiflava]
MTEPVIITGDGEAARGGPPHSKSPARGRDEEFESFVRARGHALLRTGYLLTGDRQLAEDLVQSTLARTHRAWQRLHESGNAEAYARKVMYHLQVSWGRKRRMAEADPETMPEPGGDDGTEALTLRLSVKQAMLRLGARQRAVLVLRFFEDRSVEDSARILGCSVGTVKSQTAKALARLRLLAPELAEIAGIDERTAR